MNGIGKLLSNPFTAKQKEAPKAQEQGKLGKARAVFEDMPAPKTQASTSKGMKGVSEAGPVGEGVSESIFAFLADPTGLGAAIVVSNLVGSALVKVGESKIDSYSSDSRHVKRVKKEINALIQRADRNHNKIAADIDDFNRRNAPYVQEGECVSFSERASLIQRKREHNDFIDNEILYRADLIEIPHPDVRRFVVEPN